MAVCRYKEHVEQTPTNKQICVVGFMKVEHTPTNTCCRFLESGANTNKHKQSHTQFYQFATKLTIVMLGVEYQAKFFPEKTEYYN
jgi:hypothetical protein